MSLAKILLRDSNIPRAITGKLSIKTLYHQHTLVAEIMHGCLGNRQAEGLENLQAKPLILD